MSQITYEGERRDERPDNLEAIDGQELDQILLVAGEGSMPDERSEAVQLIDEALVESPYGIPDVIRTRGQTNHQDAMTVALRGRMALDPEFDATAEVHEVEWPEMDSGDDGWSDAVSEAFDDRNEEMVEGSDALLIVTDGSSEDYLADVTELASAEGATVYQHTSAVEQMDTSDLEEELLG